MLTTIREKTQGWFAGTVLVLIAALFVVGGVASYFESDSKIIVAQVAGQDIGAEEYKTALEEQRRALMENFGRNLNPKLFDSAEFKARVLDGLVDQALLLSDAEAQGYLIGAAELDQRITSIPAFQREGRFDPKLYQMVLRDMRMTPQDLKQRLRQEAILKQVADGFELSTLVTAGDIDTLLRLETQSRLASYIVIKPQQYLSRGTVSDGDIEQYYAANNALFKSPERVRIEYLRLSAADLATHQGPSVRPRSPRPSRQPGPLSQFFFDASICSAPLGVIGTTVTSGRLSTLRICAVGLARRALMAFALLWLERFTF